jgi:uncharacterized protein (DUF1800 family)
MEENRNSQSEKIKHLYWRAGFGLSPKQWQERRTWRVERAVDQLFSEVDEARRLNPIFNADAPNSSMARSERNEARTRERKRMADVTYDWIMQMGGMQASSDLIERMSLFWHGHFACRTKTSFFADLQLESFKTYALGSFKDLLMAITKDAAMMRFLNNQQNRKLSPNENFARELMELFTMGRGNYSEQDVKEAARAFTGWTTNRLGVFEFQKRFHDFGRKNFLGLEGYLDGEDIIDQILTKPATALFICRKIYGYFVNEQVDEEQVSQLADSFYRSNYDIGQLMRQIFQSEWFYDAHNRANKIKSPVVLLAGMARHLQFSGILPANLAALQKALGQQLFAPPNVAGWKGGKAWVNNSTLLLRLQLAGAIFQISNINYSIKTELDQSRPWQLKGLELKVNMRDIQALTENTSKANYFDELADFLISPQLAADKSTVMSFANAETNESLVRSLCALLMSLPEYQLH